jgi:acyl-CoA thioester hydrolase
MFEHRVVAGWGDMDFNGHMRNTAFLDKSADARLTFFAAAGFPVHEFMRLRIGPVVRRDELEYFREIRMLDEVQVRLISVGLADDGSRFIVRNEFFRSDGTLAARVTSSGGWLHLDTRKLVVPPEDLRRALASMPRADDFHVLPSL